jgi:hypothetical protein
VRWGALRGVRAAARRPLLPLQALPAPHRDGFSVTALAAPGSYRTVSGEDLIRSWDPGNGGWIKSFCGECGSQVSTTNPEDHALVAVRMGALDEDPGIRPSVHQFVPFAAPWAPVPDDGLPRFPERLGATPPEPA